MKLALTLKKSHLLALAVIAPKDMTAPYLCGVMIEVGENESRLVATDGHRLGVIRSEYATDRPFRNADKTLAEFDGQVRQFIVPRSALAKIKQDKASDACVFAWDSAAPGEFLLDLLDGTRFEGNLVEGEFPDYRRTIPAVVSGQPAQFKLPYLVDFKKVQDLLGSKGATTQPYVHQNGTGPALVTLAQNPEFVGLLMPHRADANTLATAWARDRLALAA